MSTGMECGKEVDAKSQSQPSFRWPGQVSSGILEGHTQGTPSVDAVV